jgi:murein L,D-transpeptidase YafK
MVLTRAIHLFRVLSMAVISAMAPVLAHAGRDANVDFLGQQKQYARVREALRNKADALDRSLDAQGLKSSDLNILIIAYKSEAVLDIYAKKPDETRYKKLNSYPVCAASGKLGPKRKQGDKQVPEGFYRIDRFNPVSYYHLSLGIDYPNAADKRKTRAIDPGGDIFIHGSCVTIGCLPMTDAVIEEIYLYAVYARNNGQKAIPVYIFPFRMTRENMEKYATIHRGQPEMLAFWRNLKQGYDKFAESGEELTVKITGNGDYGFGP